MCWSRRAAPRRDAAAAQSFFLAGALRLRPVPVEVVTDRAPVCPQIVDEMAPAARHITDRYANNSIEADHGRFKARLRAMRGLKRLTSARSIAARDAFAQNLRCGHNAITTDLPVPGGVVLLIPEDVCLDRHAWPTRAAAHHAIVDYIACFSRARSGVISFGVMA
jgi:hypothetical protein